MAYRGVPRAPALTGREHLQMVQEDGHAISATVSQIAGAAARLIELPSVLGSAFCGNRFHFPYNGVSSGSLTGATYRTTSFTPKTKRITGPRLVYVNGSLTASGEQVGANDISITAASVEYNGVLTPVYFNGVRAVTIPPGGMAISDPVVVSIPADTQYWVRSYVTVGTLGMTWPVGGTGVFANNGEGYTGSGNKADDAAFLSFANVSTFGPACIIGSIGGGLPNVVVMGSSSAWGQGDTAEGPYWDYGYLSRALTDAGIPYGKLTRASDTIAQFLAGYTMRLKYLMAIRPTHIITQAGSNDLTSGASFATMQSRLLELWSILDSLGAKVIQATFTPVTTSSDNWSTLAGQTKHSSNDVRVAINEWIRSKPSPLVDVIECCDFVESARNSGLWNVDGTANKYTPDGTHQSQFAHRGTAAGMVLGPVLMKYNSIER